MESSRLYNRPSTSARGWQVSQRHGIMQHTVENFEPSVDPRWERMNTPRSPTKDAGPLKFVHRYRNTTHKANIAAESAQLEQLAKRKMPDESDEDLESGSTTSIVRRDDDSKQEEWMLSPRFTNTRQPGSLAAMKTLRASLARAGSGTRSLDNSADGPLRPNIWGDLDKGLERVQTKCKHAARRFLRNVSGSGEKDLEAADNKPDWCKPYQAKIP
ncbi:hypothetical protein B0T24DRAFT_709005 [Lasiosphaeria ovina]|uniref:Uncharacterized protein n=1 Tax=Lasiosphaeria ovina TaxID=92902 RepID=A0AAE0JZW4_9PEZI|nr:hypothetical protein B0T24DRAFT_709005 [Lasiosphaeria ovina]